MRFEEINVELKETRSDKTIVEELVIDHERRIVHIFSNSASDSFSPSVEHEYGSISFSNRFLQYNEKIFYPQGYHNGLNNHTSALKNILVRISWLAKFVPEEEHENYLQNMGRQLQLDVWIQSWTWCFYSGGNTIYVYVNGDFESIYIPRIKEQSQYLLDLLYNPFKERAIEIQNKYLRGEAGKF